MKDCLALFGLISAGQVFWLIAMMYAASLNVDKTTGGAYCAVWMLGIPAVFIVSLLAGMLLFWRRSR